MNSKVTFTLLISALLLNQSLALPLWGLSVAAGLGPFGPLGLGGPLGLLALRRAALLGTGLLGPGLLLGKRDVDSQQQQRDLDLDEQVKTNTTLCAYTSQNTMLTCAGAFNFECRAKQQLFGMENVKLRLGDFEMVPAAENKFDVLRIFSRASSGKFTFIEPESRNEVVLSFYNSNDVKEPGFLINDQKCWSQYENMIRNSERDEVSLHLIVN